MGIKRTGPDLMRVGNYRTTDWHENHMWDPAELFLEVLCQHISNQFTNIADIETAYAEAYIQLKLFLLLHMIKKVCQNLVHGKKLKTAALEEQN